MTRGSSLTDPKVIEKINAEFVPIELNVTLGFPKELPGLKLWERAYERKFKSLLGFTTTVILDPEGREPLGTAGTGFKWEFDSSPNYRADKYLAFLDATLERFRRTRAVREDSKLGDGEKEKKLAELKTETERAIDESAKEVGLFKDTE